VLAGLSALGAIGAAAATAWFTARFYYLRASAELQAEFQSRFNERKWQAYTDFADTVRELLEDVRRPAGKRKDINKHFLPRLYKFTAALWLVGSDEVIRAVGDWRETSNKAADDASAGPEGIVALVNILIAMRRDLGNLESKIEPRDILVTFINDPDTFLSGDWRNALESGTP